MMNDIEKELHLQDVNVDCIEDVLKNASIDSVDVTETVQIDKLGQVKVHIKTLKSAWVLSKAALSFVNGLENESLVDDVEENWLNCPNHVQEKELLSKERKESKKVSNEIDDIEERLEQHAEDIQSAHEKIEEQKIQIQNKLSGVKEKMERLKRLQERKELLELQKREHTACSTANVNKEHLSKKLDQTGDALAQCSGAVDSLTEDVSLLESERETGQKALIKLEEKLSTLRAQQEISSKSSKQEWMNYYYNILTSFGLRVVKLSENWIEIELSDIYDDGDNASTIHLTVHFNENDDGLIFVDNVTANCSTCFIKDLIDHLKSSHEVNVFNFEVQERFHNHVKLLQEMKSLQERFAIDWNEDKHIVRLMLGKSGQIVCTLEIERGYPRNGNVSVLEIHGADPAIVFQDNLVTNELRTLTGWVQYLDIKYSSL